MPADEHPDLPWDALRQTEGEIPWTALEAFADALAAEPHLWETLCKSYEECIEEEQTSIPLAWAYVPAIVALAAPRLSEDVRRDVGAYLVEDLVEACYEGGDLAAEVLMAAAGCCGPAIVPKVLDCIEDEYPEGDGGWFYLWSLASLAAKADDPALRDRAAELAMRTLHDGVKGRLDLSTASPAARLAAALRHEAARPVIKELRRKPITEVFGKTFQADLDGALETLAGKPPEYPELWEEPVREWFGARWEMISRPADEEDADEDEEADDEDREDRAIELANRFMDSGAAAALPEAVLEDAGFIVQSLVNYAWNYPGVEAEDLDEAALREVLLEVFPRKVSAEPMTFEHVAPVTQTFLRWLKAEGILKGNAEALAAAVGRWHDPIVRNAADPARWGMAKSMAMTAKREGYDPTNPQDFDRFIAAFNAGAFGAPAPDETDEADEAFLLPPIHPIVNEKPEVGRNDPCPCGSGKKYKKCCMRKE